MTNFSMKVIAVILLLVGFTISTPAFSDGMNTVRKHHRVHRKVHHRTKKVIVKTKTKTTVRTQPPLKRNYPVPGAGGGEDRNDDWYRRRALPKNDIDPSYYTNALEQARKIPVYRRGGKTSPQASMNWQCVGPYKIGGRVTSIATHPTDSNTFYVGAAAGGVWKTSDHGNTWQALTDTFPMLSVGCITIDAKDPKTIYIGMGECNASADSYPGNGIWRSENDGLSWTYLGLAATQYISKIIIDPSNRNTLYVCAQGPTNVADSNRGIWKSTNFGSTWTRSLLVRVSKSKTASSVPMSDLVINPQDNLDLVAATWQHIDFNVSTSPQTGLWRTRDGGQNWIRIDSLPASNYPNGYKSKRLARISLYWANTQGKSTLYSVVAKVDKNIQTGFNLDENLFGIFKTNDPEAGWQIVLDSTFRIPFLGNNIDSIDLFNHQGGYNNFITGNPKRPDEIYVGGIDIIRTTDAGAHWKNISDGYIHYFNNSRDQHSDQHALAFTAAISGNDLLNGSDGGVFHTTDFGANWKQLKGIPITMFYHLEPWVAGMTSLGNTFPADSIKLIGGTQDNGTNAHGFSPNTDWDWINRGDGGESQTHPTNPNILITSLQLGKIFVRTTLDSLRPNLKSDDGKSDPNPKKWIDLSKIAQRRGITDSSEPCAFIPPVVLDKQNPTDLYTGRLRVYKTIFDYSNPDSGTVIKQWSPQLAGQPGSLKQWYYGDIGAISLGAPDSHGRRMIWAAAYLGGKAIWRTTVDATLSIDSMPKWIRADNGLPNAYPNVIVADRSDSLTAFVAFSGSIADATGHIFKTIDGGKNWTKIGVGLPNISVNALVIDSLAENNDPLKKNQFLIAGTDVGVFGTTDGGAHWYQLGVNIPHLVVGSLTTYKNWLIAGTHGRSAWALDITDFSSQLQGDVSDRTSPASALTINAVYPNPARNSVRVNITDTEQREHSIELFDANGTIILHSTMIGKETEILLPTSLSSGAYILRVTNSNGKTAQQLLEIVK